MPDYVYGAKNPLRKTSAFYLKWLNPGSRVASRMMSPELGPVVAHMLALRRTCTVLELGYIPEEEIEP